GFHDHARPSAERRVVDGAMLVFGEVAHVRAPHLHEAALEGLAEQAGRDEPLDGLREQRDHLERECLGCRRRVVHDRPSNASGKNPSGTSTTMRSASTSRTNWGSTGKSQVCGCPLASCHCTSKRSCGPLELSATTRPSASVDPSSATRHTGKPT